MSRYAASRNEDDKAPQRAARLPQVGGLAPLPCRCSPPGLRDAGMRSGGDDRTDTNLGPDGGAPASKTLVGVAKLGHETS